MPSERACGRDATIDNIPNAKTATWSPHVFFDMQPASSPDEHLSLSMASPVDSSGVFAGARINFRSVAWCGVASCSLRPSARSYAGKPMYD